jgi:SAM-dependent methyltransferase
MNELLPALYDHIEPVALRIAARAAALEPVDDQRAYLVDVARRIVAYGGYRSAAPAGPVPEGITATLAWFELLERHLDDFVAGRMQASDIISEGGGRLWEAFQARDVVCAVYGHGVARALGPQLSGKEVLEIGTGTGGTTRRLVPSLFDCKRFVISDVRQSFLDRLAADLREVRLETALIDINVPRNSLGSFDVILSTNCVHVAKDLPATLGWLGGLLKPGGALVLGEGSHYSDDVPSPVSLVLSLFDGWWDAPTSPARPQPGFLLPDQWFAALEAAGFEGATMERWGDRRRTFGGVYWAFAPRS